MCEYFHLGATGGFVLLRAFFAAVLLLTLSPAARAAVETVAPEYAVKAAFVYKFGGFIEWPQTVFETPESPTNLCILGTDPFGAALDKAVTGQRIADHQVQVRRMDAVAPKSGCQILFIAGQDEKKIAAALNAVRGENVLTITDGAPTPATAGIINFVIADNRVRFEIDDQAASVNGVVISSKLLDLARTTKKRS